MPYTLNKTNGLVLAVVQDGKIEDTTTDLTFVGKNYTGYGEAFNENFVKLLESFANPNQPKKPLSGQLWFDSSNKVIKVYNGSMFKRLGQLESGPNEPSNPNKGDLWYRTSDGALCVFNGATWTKIGPAISQGLTGAVLPATLIDTNSVSHTVLKQDIGNATVVVASNDAFAIPSVDDFYTRFNVIKQGLSLPNVTAEVLTEALPSVAVPLIANVAPVKEAFAVVLPILKLVRLATAVSVVLLTVKPVFECTAFTVVLPTTTEVFAT